MSRRRWPISGRRLADVARCATIPRMAREISQRELRNDSGEIMRQLERGETFVVTRNGVPVGQLGPLRRRRFVSADAAVAAFQGAPPVKLHILRRDLDRIARQVTRPRG
jgi:antitoxin (DNA-binding transcriptional repressor) of toxin-antitoxin stability system